MATAKEYAYFLKGNKVSIVEKDTSFDNDVNSQDYGPGSNRAQWKSPLTTVADGIELEYTYAPSYHINDADDTKAITAYAESGGLLWFTVASMSATAGDWIVIRGSSKWNGLHQVNATISGAIAIVTNTKYNGPAVTEASTLYQDVDVMNSDTAEDFTLPVTDYQADAMVYFVKAKIAEDRQDYEQYEYLMSKFKKMLEQNENAKVWGSRMLYSGPNAIR